MNVAGLNSFTQAQSLRVWWSGMSSIRGTSRCRTNGTSRPIFFAAFFFVGCLAPVVAWKGRGILLDGHNRIGICRAKGIPFAVVEIELPSRQEAMAWIIRNQFARRNLTPYQRAELALKLEPLVAAKAKERMQMGKKADPSANVRQGKTSEALGKAAGLSPRTIDKAKRIAAGGSEGLKTAARSGQVSISAAAKVAALPKAEQDRAVAAGRVKDGAKPKPLQSPAAIDARRRNKAARELIRAEAKAAPGFVEAVNKLRQQIIICREEKFRGATSFEAARCRVQALLGLIDLPF